MRPLFGSTTTTLPLKLPSASIAAARTSWSSPKGLSLEVGSPKELTRQGLQLADLCRWRWLLRGVIVTRPDDERELAEVELRFVGGNAPRAVVLTPRSRLARARQTRSFIEILTPPN